MAKKINKKFIKKAKANKNVATLATSKRKPIKKEIMKKEEIIAAEQAAEVVVANDNQQEEKNEFDKWFKNLGKEKPSEEQVIEGTPTEVGDCDEVPEEIVNNQQNEEGDFENSSESLGQNEPSEEKTTTEVEDCGCDDNENTPVRKTWKAVINGESQDIIIAFTDYNMEIPKKKHELFKLVDKENLLPVKYNLALPDIFWKEGYPLTDCNGISIEQDTPNVYVLCSEAGTNCRIMFDEVLEDVAIHEFESVKDWAVKVGTTHQLTLAMNKVKEVGIAGLATGEKAAKEVFDFSKENGVNTSISEIFLDTRLKPQSVSKMMLGIKPKMELAIGRTPEEAQLIFDQCRLTFGDGEVKKRYVGRAVNSILKHTAYAYSDIYEYK